MFRFRATLTVPSSSDEEREPRGWGGARWTMADDGSPVGASAGHRGKDTVAGFSPCWRDEGVDDPEGLGKTRVLVMTGGRGRPLAFAAAKDGRF